MRKLSLLFIIAIVSSVSLIVFGQNKSGDLRTVKQLPSKEKRWAVIIGVDNYRDRNVTDLAGTVNDANALRDALVNYAGFPKDQIVMFTSDEKDDDRQPTRANIIAWFDNLESTVPEDGLLLFAFSGHGKEGKNDGKIYLMPSDVKLTQKASSLEQFAISVDFIKQQIKAAHIQQVLVLLDSCRNEPQADKGDGDNLLSDNYRNNFDFDVRNKEVEAFAILYATSVGKRAYEFADRETGKQRGFFSWALVKGLEGAAANEKGEVTLLSLIKYIEDTVPRKLKRENVSGYQRPSTDMGGYKSDELVIAIKRRVEQPTITRDNESQRDRDWALVNKNNCGEIELFLRSHQGDFEATLYQSRLSCNGKSSPNTTTKSSQGAEYYINRGLEHYNAKDYDQVIADCTEAIKLDPKYAIAYTFRGVAYFNKHSYDQAIADFTEAINRDPKYATSYSYRGRAYLNKGNYDQAIADCTKAIKLDPKAAPPYFIRGVSYFLKDNNDQAIADCTEAIKLDPKYESAYFVRGSAYIKRDDYDSALFDCTEAIKLDPKDAHYYYCRAFAYYNKGDYDKAIADYTESIKLDSDYVDVYKRRGDSYYKKSKYDDAIADYTEAIKLGLKDADIYISRGLAYHNKKNYDQAIADFTESIKLDPKNARVYVIRGINYSNKGIYENAIEDYTEAIKLNPDYIDAYSLRASAYDEIGDSEKAEADKQKAKDLEKQKDKP